MSKDASSMCNFPKCGLIVGHDGDCKSVIELVEILTYDGCLCCESEEQHNREDNILDNRDSLQVAIQHCNVCNTELTLQFQAHESQLDSMPYNVVEYLFQRYVMLLGKDKMKELLN